MAVARLTKSKTQVYDRGYLPYLWKGACGVILRQQNGVLRKAGVSDILADESCVLDVEFWFRQVVVESRLTAA